MGPSAATTGHYNWKLQQPTAYLQYLAKKLYEHKKDNDTFYNRKATTKQNRSPKRYLT
jgi:hypothetical protein